MVTVHLFRVDPDSRFKGDPYAMKGRFVGCRKNTAIASICPQSAVDKLEKEKMPRKGGRWWFSWRRRDFSAEEVGGHGHEAGQAQDKRQNSDGCSFTAWCPQGELDSQGAAGVSWSSWQGSAAGSGEEDDREQRTWGSAPSPAVVASPQVLHLPETCPYCTDGKTEI